MIIPEAQRLKPLNEYYFARKLEQVRLMNEAGRDVVNLGIGSPDLAPSPETLQVTEAALRNPRNHGYPSYRGSPALRKAIAQWYQRTYHVKVDPDHHVLPLLGSKEGIFYTAMAFLNPGDQALVPNPGYLAYSAVCQLVGAQAVSYELQEETKWWPDFAALSQMDLSNVKLMFVNYPHMPTGAKGSDMLFGYLAEFAKAHRILICHDNPYSMVLNPDPPRSFLSADSQMQVGLELNSLSKSFNMAGWRVGMMISNAEVINTVLKVKSNVDSGMFLPIQEGAVEAFNNSVQWHSERNAIYKKRREWVYRIFDVLGFEYSREQVGLFVWAKAPPRIANVEIFVDELLEKSAVFLTPGFIFGSRGARYARSSLCATEERLQIAYERLRKLS